MDYYTRIEHELAREQKKYELEQKQLGIRYNKLMKKYGKLLLEKCGTQIYNMNINDLEKLTIILVTNMNI